VAAKRSTSLDVASLAGVSAAAVSRAFTPGASIAPDTKKRVMEAAKQLGYHPNVIARSLNQRRSKLIGLLMSGWNNFGYVEILRLLTEKLEGQGYEVMLKSVLDGAQMGETVRQVLQYQVAAIVVVSEVVPASVTADCARSGVPIVLVNRIGRGTGNSAVSLDGVLLGHRIGDFLLARRHRRIALLRGRNDIDFTGDIMAAITARIEATSSSKVVADESGVLGYEAGRRAINALFAEAEPPDAVFCSYDDTAIGVMDGARIDLGVRIPEELAVIGNGNRGVASWGSHELTTVEYPRDEVIEKTLTILMSRLEDPELAPEAVLIEPTLVVRGSTRQETE
jgi:DNA-binding LacI/PurR family transcriptional regulator